MVAAGIVTWSPKGAAECLLRPADVRAGLSSSWLSVLPVPHGRQSPGLFDSRWQVRICPVTETSPTCGSMVSRLEAKVQNMATGGGQEPVTNEALFPVSQL